ncbi:MAG: ACT domain-containing protein [Leptospiraceae bacterium]|nr:ACT domain-containing protein [Leptospiraceae bacterium]MDW7976393.1 ACT domain-containing protein [Leptospiraceae bacterium]
MKIVPQLTIIASNKPGVLANICGSLSDENINITGISVVDHIEYAIIRMVVSDPKKAIHLLGEAGVPVLESEVIEVPLKKGPGSLEYVAEILANENLNIEYVYATESPSNGGESILFLKSNDNKKAFEVLQKKLDKYE